MQRGTRRQVLAGLVLAGVLLAAVLTRSPATLLSRLAALSARPLLFAGLLCGLYLLRPLVLWPISAVSILVGFVYGPVLGVPIALAGSVVTSLPAFVMARRVGSDGGPFERLAGAGERLVAVTGGFRGLVAARLIPLPPDATSYAAGLSGLAWATFVAGTVVGELPWVVAAVLAGDSMRTLTLSGVDNAMPVVVGAAALGLLLLAGPAYRQWRRDGGPLSRSR
jgi:uncharacterized membrane protein YdjX (TVP38/TMEM64 family)